MYRIIWNNNDIYYEEPVYRNPPRVPNPADQRPTEIDADSFEFNTGERMGGYFSINFLKNGAPVAAIFQMPVAIVTVADIPE